MAKLGNVTGCHLATSTGWAMAADDLQELLRELQYDRLIKLGEGGMGLAFCARCLTDGSLRVLKINWHVDDKGAEEDLLQEGRTLKSLLGPAHNIIIGLRIFQFGTVSRLFWFQD